MVVEIEVIANSAKVEVEVEAELGNTVVGGPPVWNKTKHYSVFLVAKQL